MGLDLTSFDSALKQHYTDDRVENLVYMDNPLLALMPKYESFGGRNLPIPLIYGNPQGRSAAFATAQTRGAATSTKLEDFVLTRVKDYSIATIDNETLESSKSSSDAFMEAATTEIDGAINSLSRSIAVKMYRDGWGDVGVIGSISSNTITLSDVETVTNFEVGQQIVVSSSQNAAVLRSGSAIITNVDRDLGTITLDALSGITGETVRIRLRQLVRFFRGLAHGFRKRLQVLQLSLRWIEPSMFPDWAGCGWMPVPCHLRRH